MAVKALPYKSLKSLIRAFLFAYVEGKNTRTLIWTFAEVRRRGYLTKAELEKVCVWKSPRVMKQVKRNSPLAVRNITRAAFSCSSELDKIKTLVTLHGVGVPMASAILMFADPRHYAVIDIRGWQLLHAMKAVKENGRGVNLTPGQWVEFLEIVRSHARQFRVTARDVQQALFQAHVEFQEGRLYED
jgi:hypothetical protein